MHDFVIIHHSIKKLQSLKDQQAKDELRKYTKKKQIIINHKIVEMSEKLGGIANLEAVPEAILAFDVRHEKTAIEEAKSVGVKVVALCDSNVNPAPVDFVVPGNDDSVKSIALFANLAAEAIKEGNVLAAAAALERKAAMAKPVSAPAPVVAAKA
jgi:small subunit ribosomal protein S2